MLSNLVARLIYLYVVSVSLVSATPAPYVPSTDLLPTPLHHYGVNPVAKYTKTSPLPHLLLRRHNAILSTLHAHSPSAHAEFKRSLEARYTARGLQMIFTSMDIFAASALAYTYITSLYSNFTTVLGTAFRHGGSDINKIALTYGALRLTASWVLGQGLTSETVLDVPSDIALLLTKIMDSVLLGPYHLVMFLDRIDIPYWLENGAVFLQLEAQWNSMVDRMRLNG
ncbi:MAG: hypothetical protein Q9181_005079 [Wetmoreana brouardii]